MAQNLIPGSELKKTNLTAMSTLTFMFFSFGFVTSMNNILIPYMKSIFALSDAASMFINMVWYGAYAIASIPSSFITEKFGYKNGMLIGLIICALGGFLYYPATLAVSYAFFLTATFVLALGITLLQVAANPYVVEIDPHDSTAVRMNIVGTASSSASMIAPILGGILFLGTITQLLNPGQMQTMKDGGKLVVEASQAQGMAQAMQVPYIALGAAFLVIGLIIAMIKLPTIARNTNEQGTIAQAWKHKHLRWGVLAIFIYVGLEIAVPSFMVRYATDKQIWGIAPSEAAQYVTFYFLAMLFGRFSGIFVMKKLTDKQALSIYAFCGILLVLAGILAKGQLAIIALVVTGICQSVMWGNIFALATKGLNHLTNKATSLMLTAIAGGGIITLLMGFLVDHWGVKSAFALMVPLYGYMIWFALSAGKMERKMKE
jgi:MFS transporter, FHS family, L-fucose permease